MAARPGRLLAFFRTLAPPTPDHDDELLRRFAVERDTAALDAVVRRYAGLVMGVCRRRFGMTPDADDAFQATFLVLAKSARSVRHLPAWLHRVATLTCLKLASRQAMRGMAPMEIDVPDDAAMPPDSGAAAAERDAILDDELTKLPETLRSVVVLCTLDGLSNSEAAKRLGIPVGTVDSRLHAAKAKLRERLTKRGLTTATIAGLTSPLASPVVADELIRSTVTAAAGFAFGEAVATPLVTFLSHEVLSSMTTIRFKLLAGAALCLTLAGGTGLYMAQAKNDPQTKTAKPETPKKDEPKKVVDIVAENPAAAGTTAATTAVLSKPHEINGQIDMPLGELLEQLGAIHNATFRAEQAWFREKGEANIYDKPISIRITKGLSVADILDEVTASLSQPVAEGSSYIVGYRIKGNQVIIGPKFVPASAPSGFRAGPDGPLLQVPSNEIVKTLYGPTVSISVKNKSLEEVLDLLREQTGANIVLNKSQITGANHQTLTLTLNDTKLFTVLKVISDQYNLAPATVDNVFYITSKSRAEEMNRETSTALFGPGDQQTVFVPVDKDGKFVPHRQNEMFGGVGGGGGNGASVAYTLVPVQVDEKKADGKKVEAVKP